MNRSLRHRPRHASSWLPVLVEVDQPIEDVPTGGATRLHVTVMRGGRPVGTVVVDAPLDPLPADLLADALVAAMPDVLAGDPFELDRSSAVAHPTASALVCTRDRPDDLARCLASLRAQTVDLVEIVVVDNDPIGDDATRDVVRRAGARYLHEPRPGLDRARNLGFAAALGDVVVCTDDDVEVAPTWAGHLLACFADPLVMAATGLVLPARLDTPARQRFERYAGFGRGFRRFELDGTRVAPVAAGRAGAGASMAICRRFVLDTGGFPPELDAGTPTESGGDTYLLYRVLRAGFRVVYEPSAMAFHHHRSTDDALRRAVRGYGVGAVAYLLHAARSHHDLLAALAAVRWTEELARRAARSLAGRPGAAPRRLALAELAGALAAPVAYRRARRWASTATPTALPCTPAAPPPPGPAPVQHAVMPAPALHPATDGLPSLSVVIPSRSRRDRLLSLLTALDGQCYPDELVEVVVCLDGDVDGSAAAVAAAPLRRPPRVVRSGAACARPAGAAATRAAGVAAATHDVVLFLDDDVEPTTDELLLAHAAAHGGPVPVAAVGPCPPAPLDRAGTFARAVRNWWVDHTRAVLEGGELAFTDVLTGNLSIARSVLDEVGGFAALPRREDWELGYRLQRAGVAIVAAPGAVVLHHADVDVRSAVRDRRAEGAADVAFSRAHPEVAPRLPSAGLPDLLGRRRRLALLARRLPTVGAVLAAIAVRAASPLDAVGAPHRADRILQAALTTAYWSGVGDATRGGRAAVVDPGVARSLADPSVLDLDDLAGWCPPSAGGATDATVVAAGRVLGTAPLRWGGFPWDRQRFLDIVAHRFAAAALHARALGAAA